MSPTPTPFVLPPARPSELLAYITQHARHPTTLLIGATSAEFLASLAGDLQDASLPNQQSHLTARRAEALLAAPLYQVAIARHIRVVFLPTVTHLRAYLAVFDPADSEVPPPPPPAAAGAWKQQAPLLLVYGFLALHRDTSEWSAQGMEATAAGVVEAARRCGFRAVLVDAPGVLGAGAGREGETGGVPDGGKERLLHVEVPLLSARVLRAGGDLDAAAWTGRKVALGQILGRCFRFPEREWARDTENDKP